MHRFFSKRLWIWVGSKQLRFSSAMSAIRSHDMSILFFLLLLLIFFFLSICIPELPKLFGQRLRKSCKLGRNSERTYVHTYPHPGLIEASEGRSWASKGLSEASQCLSEAFQGLPGPVWALPRTVQGLPGPVRGLPRHVRGLSGPQWASLRPQKSCPRLAKSRLIILMDLKMEGHTDGIFPHSTGLRPLPGPLPCSNETTNITEITKNKLITNKFKKQHRLCTRSRYREITLNW